MSNAAVVDGKQLHTSASQISTFRQCPRKWFYSRVLRIPEPESKSQATGTATHSKKEAYYETGVLPAEDSTIIVDQSILKMVKDPRHPPRDPSILIEQPRDYMMGIKIAGVPVKGRIDLQWPQPTLGLHDIWDWKTAKTFNYVKDEDDLRHDVQLNIYGFYAFSTLPWVKEVRYTHGYLRTEKSPGYKIVQTDPVPLSHVEGMMEGIEASVEDMKKVATATKVEDVPFNTMACGMFGGCPFRDRCPLTFLDRLGAVAAGETTATQPPAAGERTMTTLEKTLAPPSDTLPSKVNWIEESIDALVAISKDEKASAAERLEAVKVLMDRGLGKPAEIVLGLELYVDTHPTKGGLEFPHLEEEVHRRLEEIRGALKLEDVREGPMAFGKWRTALAKSFIAKPIYGKWLASSRGEFNQAALDHLRPLAAVIWERLG